MAKVKAFSPTDPMGGQYINTRGETVTVEKNAIVVDADHDTMYATKISGSNKRKVLKYGWRAIEDYLPPATPVDVKVQESEALKKLSEENVALKAKLDEKNESA